MKKKLLLTGLLLFGCQTTEPNKENVTSKPLPACEFVHYMNEDAKALVTAFLKKSNKRATLLDPHRVFALSLYKQDQKSVVELKEIVEKSELRNGKYFCYIEYEGNHVFVEANTQNTTKTSLSADTFFYKNAFNAIRYDSIPEYLLIHPRFLQIEMSKDTVISFKNFSEW
jgi:hypothetical protein